MNKNDYPKTSERFHSRLCSVLENLPDENDFDREELNKMTKIKKTVLVVAAAAVLMSATVFAGSVTISKYISSSSGIPEYTEVISKQEMQKDFGFAFEMPESFSNGYTFKDAVNTHTKSMDEGDSVVEKYDEISAQYEKDGKRISLYVNAGTEPERQQTDAREYDGCKFYFTSYTNKLVPGDYVLTPEDEAAQANGELVFSYGMDEVTISEVQSVAWTDNGINYLILGIDSELDEQELMKMAHELFDRQN